MEGPLFMLIFPENPATLTMPISYDILTIRCIGGFSGCDHEA